MRFNVMYTRADFGNELKDKVIKKQNVAVIGEWAYSVYLEHVEYIDLDPEFRNILFILNFMDVGPKAEFSYERLLEMADDLITGRTVNLQYD